MNSDSWLVPGDDETRDALDAEAGRVFDAYLAARQTGLPMTPERLLAEHPHLAGRLRTFLEVTGWVGEPGGAASILASGWSGSDAARCVLPRGPHGEPTAPPRPAGDEAGGGRYRLLGEIARGGMGVVLRGHDAELGRDLAVKVLLERHRDDPGIVRRFVEEAQIGGQLQHPGIVPVYDLGVLSDRRPFFAMKLVHGQTLAALLAERPGPAHDLPRFLSVFEAVCQTLAYAHARGVIHRDLKPSNIMVGRFGEVQVMDWGLAKVRFEESFEKEPHRSDPNEALRTVRSGSDGGASTTGSVLGTPAYMPPEQARGEVDRLDERVDVFGLGAILCEILTGAPPYQARSPVEVRARAVAGDLADALGRLARCGADAELASLAADCLAAEPAGRPRDAGAVAERITGYLMGVQQRLRAAELAQARAEAHADEERKRRRLTVALASSILLLAGLAGAAAFVYQRQVNEESNRVAVALSRAAQSLEAARQSWAGVQDDAPYGQAVHDAEAAEGLLTGRLPVVLRTRTGRLAAEARAEAATARSDHTLLDDLAAVRSSRVPGFPRREAAVRYGRLFASLGVSPDRDPAEISALADKLKNGRPGPIVAAFASLLDDWSIVLGTVLADRPRAERIASLARALDPDPWRNRLRAALITTDAAERLRKLKRLAAEPDAASQPAPTLTMLAAALIECNDAEAAVALLRPARRRHRRDPWVFHTLGLALRSTHPPRNLEALRAFTVANTLRPTMATSLVEALALTGETTEAIEVLEELLDSRPDAWRYHLLGELQRSAGISPQAAFTRAVAVARVRILLGSPDVGAEHDTIGSALANLGDLHGAIAAFRDSIRVRPDYSATYSNFGDALARSGDLPGAIAAYRRAIQLRPLLADPYKKLGSALRASGDQPGAIAAFGEALRLQREDPDLERLIRETQHEAGFQTRLPAVLAGTDRPANFDERLTLAEMAHRQGHHAGSARLWGEAFRERPELAEPLETSHRYDAACAAALAGTGHGSDDPPPDAAARCRLRNQALGWLQAELAARARQIAIGTPEARTQAMRVLLAAQVDPAFVGVRSTEALAKLPDDERPGWEAVWGDLARTIDGASDPARPRR